MDRLNANTPRTKRRHGVVSTRPDRLRTPCIPSRPGELCETCDRRNDWLPSDAESRPFTVACDASTLPVVWCPMFVHRRERALTVVHKGSLA